MNDLTMRSDHRHYMKYYFRAYAIKGGPWKQKYSNDIYFGSLTEERIDKDYLEEHHYRIRAHDNATSSSILPSIEKYKESSRLKINTSYTEKNYPYYSQPVTKIMKYGL